MTSLTLYTLRYCNRLAKLGSSDRDREAISGTVLHVGLIAIALAALIIESRLSCILLAGQCAIACRLQCGFESEQWRSCRRTLKQRVLETCRNLLPIAPTRGLY